MTFLFFCQAKAEKNDWTKKDSFFVAGHELFVVSKAILTPHMCGMAASVKSWHLFADDFGFHKVCECCAAQQVTLVGKIVRVEGSAPRLLMTLDDSTGKAEMLYHTAYDDEDAVVSHKHKMLGVSVLKQLK